MKTEMTARLRGAEGEPIVLEGVRGEAWIRGLFAEVQVEQRYRNPEDVNIEAVYTFPLPPDGVLLGFEAEIGGRRLAGAVVEKSEAERRYEDAVTDGDAAILLEKVKGGLYTASLGNLLPGETAVIRFTYGVLLRWNGDQVRFHLPTTIAPRYGDPSRAGLEAHQIPEFALAAERSLSLRVTVQGLLKEARFNSPSHDVAVRATGDATIVEAVDAAMDRDFVLEAHAARAQGSAAVAASDLDGWVAMASFRPVIADDGPRERRSVKVVVDCSGSMAGDSIAQARAALERVLDGLREGDEFDVIAFGSRHRRLFGGGKPVSETSIAEARRFVRSLDADMGGTEIGKALEAAYASPGERDLRADLLLITDGAFWNAGDVIDRARGSGHRIFAVGVGSAVAEAILRELVEATGGACELVAPREDIAARIYRHFQRMYAPCARSARLRWPAPVSCRFPDSVEPVYDGDTLHAFAWFAEMPEGVVKLEVELSDGRVVRHDTEILGFEETSSMRPAIAGAPAASLARIGAAKRLAAAEDAETGRALALRYQLMSPWTNYLVVHVREDGERAGDLPKILKVPQVVAAGWHGIGSVRGGATGMSVNSLPSNFYASARPASRMEPAADYSFGAPIASPQDRLERRRHFKRRTSNRGSLARRLTPHELVRLLNARSVKEIPTLKALADWCVPEEVLEVLRMQVADGQDEVAAVAAFLYVLADSKAGDALDRTGIRRRLRKSYKAMRPNRAVRRAARRAFREWMDLCAMEGLAP